MQFWKMFSSFRPQPRYRVILTKGWILDAHYLSTAIDSKLRWSWRVMVGGVPQHVDLSLGTRGQGAGWVGFHPGEAMHLPPTHVRKWQVKKTEDHCQPEEFACLSMCGHDDD
ncbi:hypothetical protein FRC02_000079 [Tulasnella sp. 418]|nr:hypothetical protein FRC02_000079 [Tulasnella sp. 418]